MNSINSEYNCLKNNCYNKKQILVLSGGFMSGYAHLGALKYIFTIIPQSQFHIMAGTSIGGIILFLLIIGYTIKEIYKIKMLHINIIENLNNLFTSNYIISTQEPQKLLEQLMIEKRISPTLTLQQLYEQTKIQLILTTTSVSTNKTIYLSHLTYPNLPILTALLMTSAFPIIFPPIEYKKKYYIDGGCTNNYPINIFKNYLSYVIGINLIDQINIKFTPTINLPEYIIYLLQLFYHNHKKRISEQYDESTLTISIKDNFLKFSSDTKKKKTLYQMGLISSILHEF